MTLLLQLLLTAAAYAAIVWAIGSHFQDAGHHLLEIALPAGAGWRRPWTSYGMLLASGGFFLIMSEVALSGFADEPHPLTFGISLLTLLAGAAVGLSGVVDKYLVRRGLPELPSQRARHVTGLFVAGAIVLPIIATFVALLGKPPNPGNPPPASQERSFRRMPTSERLLLGQRPAADVSNIMAGAFAGVRVACLPATGTKLFAPRSADVPAYDVHLFPVVRIKVSGIEAASHREAIERALERVGSNLPAQLARAGAEYAEEISHYLVDVAGDEEYRQSQWFYSAEEPLLTILRRLVIWRDGGQANQEMLAKILADARQALENCV
jgi:hypothetical protein